MPQDFDLNLSNLWYTKNPPAFPVPSMLAQGPCTSTYTWTYEQDFHHTRKILICAVRFTITLATTKVRIVWLEHDPLRTVQTQQIHTPPPAPLSAQDLHRAHETYGLNLAAWAEAALGTTVGDGECWTLVQRALLDLTDTYRRHGQEAPMISQGRNHGVLLLVLDASPVPDANAGLLQLADIRRGDILEMSSAHFHIVTAPPPPPASSVTPTPKPQGMEWGTWTQGPSEKNIRLAHHTAVVVGVDGDSIRVVEQNGSVPLGVGEERYTLQDWVRGQMSFFRVVKESWCPALKAEWED